MQGGFQVCHNNDGSDSRAGVACPSSCRGNGFRPNRSTMGPHWLICHYGSEPHPSCFLSVHVAVLHLCRGLLVFRRIAGNRTRLCRGHQSGREREPPCVAPPINVWVGSIAGMASTGYAIDKLGIKYPSWSRVSFRWQPPFSCCSVGGDPAPPGGALAFTPHISEKCTK